MPRNTLMSVIFLFALSFAAMSNSQAALVSPTAGTTITTNPVEFSWSAGASEFWLRVYDSSSDTRIFDSGRLGSSALSASVALPSSTTGVRAVFYEKMAGSWSSMETTYTVDLGTTPPPPTGVVVPPGDAPGDLLVWDGDSWEAEAPTPPTPEVFPPEDNMSPFLNIHFIMAIDGDFPTRTGADMQDTPFLGQITMFAGRFPPKGWAFCDGQLVLATDFPEIASLIGTTYGGDEDRGTIALPDLRSRVPVHAGNGIGLSRRILGRKGGYEAVHNLDETVVE